MESAASLANTIVAMAQASISSDLSLRRISASLEDWAGSRQQRMRLLCELGNGFTRLEAFHTLKDRVVGLYLGKYQLDAIADILCETTVGAEKLSFLPPPQRSLQVTMPFDTRKGIQAATRTNSLILRSLIAITIIFAVQPLLQHYIAGRIVDRSPGLHKQNRPAYEDDGSYTNQKSTETLAAMSRIADLGVLLTIWAVESCRTGNIATLMSL